MGFQVTKVKYYKILFKNIAIGESCYLLDQLMGLEHHARKEGAMPLSQLFKVLFDNLVANRGCLFDGLDVVKYLIFGINGKGAEYSCAVTPQVRQAGNHLSGLFVAVKYVLMRTRYFGLYVGKII